MGLKMKNASKKELMVLMALGFSAATHVCARVYCVCLCENQESTDLQEPGHGLHAVPPDSHAGELSAKPFSRSE